MTEATSVPQLIASEAADLCVLEDAALDLLVRIPRPSRFDTLFPLPLFTADQAIVLARRKGFDGKPPGTLQEAADMIGISRERARQLAKKLDEWIETAPRHAGTHVPEVLIEVADLGMSATSNASFMDELRKRGLAQGNWSLEAVAQLMRLCGLNGLDRKVKALSNSSARILVIRDLAASIVWEASGKSGFAHLDSIRRRLQERSAKPMPGQMPISDSELEGALGSCAGVLPLPYGYYFAAKHQQPTVVETTLRMLQIAEPLSLREIRDGLRRRCKFRQIPFKVPLAALRAFLDSRAEFVVDDRDRVTARVHQGRTRETLQSWIVGQMRASDYGMLTRNQVMERARRARKNASSVSIYLTYGEQLAHDRRGFFHPIGCPPDENVVKDALAVAGATVQPTTQLWHYNTERNSVLALIELGDSALSSGVVFADARSRAYLDLLGDAHYILLDEAGEGQGTVYRSEPMHVLAGLSTLFAHTYPEPGDLLRLEIDLDASIARAEIGGSELETA